MMAVRGLSRGLSKGTRRLIGERGTRALWTGQEDMKQVKDRTKIQFCGKHTSSFSLQSTALT